MSQAISQETSKMVICFELTIRLGFRLCVHGLVTKRVESFSQPEAFL